MALSTEIILTLQQLKGIGSRTILAVGESTDNMISTVEDLWSLWPTFKGKKFASISEDDIGDGYSAAKYILGQCAREGVGVMSIYDSVYPELLKNCTDEEGKPDPPVLLYYRGDLSVLHKPGIAVIGTREPTSNGEKAGVYFAKEFARRGYNIVSGLALGCDSAGHRGALEAGGATTAFLANGLDWDSIYPKENLELAKRIVENGGLLLSEYLVGQSSDRYKLAARDRLQAGLAYATVVIQTGISGGTMHAVNATLSSKKPLFAVKYKAEADMTKGNTLLIEIGAHQLLSEELDTSEKIIREAIGSYQTIKEPNLF